jgi:hypothetical protein
MNSSDYGYWALFNSGKASLHLRYLRPKCNARSSDIVDVLGGEEPGIGHIDPSTETFASSH